VSAARKAGAIATAVWRNGLFCEITGPASETVTLDISVV
jgi:hypothetical protein